MQVGILGPLRVVQDGEALAVDAPMQRALLAVLAVHAGEVVSADRLVEALWGDDQPTSGLRALRFHVSKLRKTLDDSSHQFVATVAPGYVLPKATVEVDTAVFRGLLADSQSALASDPQEARRLLGDALDLWRGPPLIEFEYREFARDEIATLGEERLAAIESGFEAALALGDHGAAIAELSTLVRENPYRETLRGLLITALYRSGRQAEALREYQDARTLLRDGLGIAPSRELAELEERVLRQDRSLDAPAQPPSRSGQVRLGLPDQLSSFIGREDELIAVIELLGSVRLVTLTGPGGSGKTRLALEVAARVAPGYSDGVRFVDLTRVTDPSFVPSMIADQLGMDLTAEGDDVAAIAAALRTQSMLLVLDNLEHVIESAPIISRLLASAPTVSVLATSRERLRLDGEHIYEVPPLKEADASALFVERAMAARADLDVQDSELGDAAAICAAVDHLPLAVELAAARIGVLSTAALRERLGSALSTLTKGSRNRPDRQQALRSTIDWSYGLLTPGEQRLFALLSVFSGGRSLEAVEAICGPDPGFDVLDGLQSLVDKSMMRVRTGPDGSSRFFFLETIHQYAREQSESMHDVRVLKTQHCDHFVDWAESIEPLLWRADPDPAYALLNLELENVRVALAWAFTDGDPLQGCRLLGSLCLLWWNQGQRRVLVRWEAQARCHVDQLEDAAKSRLAIVLGFACGTRGAGAEALRWNLLALDSAEKCGDVRLLIQAKALVAYRLPNDRAEFEEAADLCWEAADLARSANEPGLLVFALTRIANMAVEIDDHDVAEQLYLENLEIAERTGDTQSTIMARNNLALLEARRDNGAVGVSFARQAMQDAWDLGQARSVAFSLVAVAASTISAGSVSEGAMLLAASDRASEMIGLPRLISMGPDYAHAEKTLAKQLTEDEVDALKAKGRSMTLAEAVTLALRR